MGWNAKYALLIAISTVVTWFCGLLLERMENAEKRVKKRIIAGSFAINLGILVFFKYFDFLWDNLFAVLKVFGVEVLEQPFDIMLPVGISFYTFQALGYTMDVYRGEIKAEKNILRYALFVSFFPQLVAGPIERSKNLISQLDRIDTIKVWNYERVTRGMILMLWGFFQKMVIADRISILVDQVYDTYWMYGSIELILASVLFALQIYCDFASYSLIATGAAKILGIELMENFNTPYFACSVKEFWRRWHISLSTWFRDYLYIPLGGSRCSQEKKYRNLMITFLVSGLWHGAAWNYIFWGGVHGAYQIIGEEIAPWKEKFNDRFQVKTKSISYKLGEMLLTFLCVDYAWIFFRSNSLQDAFSLISRIIKQWDFGVLFDQSLYTLGLNQQEMHILCVALLLLLLVDVVRYRCGLRLDTFLKEQCIWFRWGVIFFLLFFIFLYGIYGPEFDENQFIYFQF